MKQLFIITLSLFVLSGTYSCKRKGCTYDSATNFSKKAKLDDGSCEFESRVSFWFNQNTSNYLMGSGVTTLHIYVSDVAVGEIAVSDWSVGADCGGLNLTVPNKYPEFENQVIKYEARSQSGTLYFSGTFSAIPNSCQSVELTY
jgi:hypothetical protein